ncbi:MAG: hypothetical protein NXI24_04725 [bacterium]|nr:hypothetical protein [bacterium]
MFADFIQKIKRLAGRDAGDPNDIDALIERIGTKHTAEDRRRAYALFLTNSLYAPVVSFKDDASEGAGKKKAAKKKKTKKKTKEKAGKKKSAKQGRRGSPDEQAMNLAMAGVNGFQMFLMYTSGEDERIAEQAQHQLQLPGRRAFEMTLQTQGVDGLLIHNRRNAWMALPNELVQEILEVFPEDNEADHAQ